MGQKNRKMVRELVLQVADPSLIIYTTNVSFSSAMNDPWAKSQELAMSTACVAQKEKSKKGKERGREGGRKEGQKEFYQHLRGHQKI